MKTSALLRCLTLSLLPIVPLQSALAQTHAFPANCAGGTVKVVVPFPAGGMGDIVARIVSADLARQWSAPVIVDNRAGASGMIGNEYVSRAPKDGCTLLLGISQLVQAPALYPKLPYDVLKDLTPLARVADGVSIFVTSDAGIKSLADYARLGREKPGAMSYGTYGAGTTAHIYGEMFNRAAGISSAHIPYKGAAPLLNDLLAGHVTVSFSDLASPLPSIRAGKLRAYAVTGTRRAPALPDVPTFQELGFKDFDVAGWYGLFAPAGLPDSVRKMLIDSLQRSVTAKETRDKFIDLGLLPVEEKQPDFASRVASDVRYWTRIIKANDIKIE